MENKTCSKPPTSYYIYIYKVNLIWTAEVRHPTSMVPRSWLQALFPQWMSSSSNPHVCQLRPQEYWSCTETSSRLPEKTIIITIVIITITTITVLLLPPWNGIRQIRFPLNSCLSSISPQILRWKTGCYKDGAPKIAFSCLTSDLIHWGLWQFMVDITIAFMGPFKPTFT